MKTDTRVSVNFCITGITLSPNELTDLLEIKPTETWLLGENIRNTIVKMKYNGWSLSSPEKNIDIEKQILYICKLLKPKTKMLNEIRKKYKLNYEFACYIRVSKNEYPPLHLKQKTLRKISQIKASIDIDII